MKINLKDTEKLEKALADVQKGCRERTYTAKDIQDMGAKVMSTLTRYGVGRKAAVGCAAYFGYNHAMPRSYKYPVMGTVGKISVAPSGLFLTELSRSRCHYSVDGFLTDAAKEAIARNFAMCLSFL